MIARTITATVALEIGADALEPADHALDLGDRAAPLLDWNFFRRMSASRDFIDFVLPQALALSAAKPPRPHARLEVVKVQSAHMSFAIMDEKQCSDRALEAICVQGLRRYWGSHRHSP